MAKINHFGGAKHALQRAEERGIHPDWFQETVLKYERRTRQGRGDLGGIVYRFEKKIGDQWLTIVAELYKDSCYFITGYWT